MKWTFVIQQKFKVILLLTIMIVLIGFTNYIEQKNMEQMEESFTSIYYDRLIPATEIFHLTENLFNKRIILQPFVNTSTPIPPDEKDQLEKYHSDIDERIARFEKTFLVQHESSSLTKFKAHVAECQLIEDEIADHLRANRSAEALTLYHQKFQPKFSEILKNLEELSMIQTSVGMDILKESKSTISNSDLMLTLQVITAIVIGLFVHGLIIASRVANLNDKNFHLN
jgi:hypothetical protein